MENEENITANKTNPNKLFLEFAQQQLSKEIPITLQMTNGNSNKDVTVSKMNVAISANAQNPTATTSNDKGE